MTTRNEIMGSGGIPGAGGQGFERATEGDEILAAFAEAERRRSERAKRAARRPLHEVMALRRASVGRHAEVLRCHACEDTGAGAVVSRSEWGGVQADSFRPRAVRRPFHREALESAHAQFAVPRRLHELPAAEKATKLAPHDLRLGDVVMRTFSYHGSYVDFFRVIGVPHPRKVTLVQLGERLVSGNSHGGRVVPDAGRPGGRARDLPRAHGRGSAAGHAGAQPVRPPLGRQARRGGQRLIIPPGSSGVRGKPQEGPACASPGGGRAGPIRAPAADGERRRRDATEPAVARGFATPGRPRRRARVPLGGRSQDRASGAIRGPIGLLRPPPPRRMPGAPLQTHHDRICGRMVVVHRAHGLRFVVFVDDHEPAHVHAFGDGQAKINLAGPDGKPELVWAHGMKRNEVRRAVAEVIEHRDALLQRWREIHG